MAVNRFGWVQESLVRCLGVQLLLVVSIPLQSCQSRTEQQAIEEGYRAAQNAETLAVKSGPQILNFGVHRLEITVPAQYTLKKSPMQGNVMYSLSGSKGSNGTGANLNIYVIAPPVGEAIPHSKVMFDGMLNPFRKRLVGYEEEFRAPIKVNGIVFENAFYSGNMFGQNIKGFVFVSRLKGVFCVLCGSDDASLFGKSEPVMIGVVKSCKVQGE